MKPVIQEQADAVAAGPSADIPQYSFREDDSDQISLNEIEEFKRLGGAIM